MAQQINPSTRVVGPYLQDDRSLFWTGTAWRPYVDVAEANAAIDAGVRVIGLQVRLASGWYEYRDGILDANLVPYIPRGVQLKMAIKVDGLAGSPVAGTYVYTHADLIGAVVLDIVVNKLPETSIDGDFIFDPVLGKITRTNQWVAGDTSLINFSR